MSAAAGAWEPTEEERQAVADLVAAVLNIPGVSSCESGFVTIDGADKAQVQCFGAGRDGEALSSGLRFPRSQVGGLGLMTKGLLTGLFRGLLDQGMPVADTWAPLAHARAGLDEALLQVAALPLVSDVEAAFIGPEDGREYMIRYRLEGDDLLHTQFLPAYLVESAGAGVIVRLVSKSLPSR